MPDQTSPLISNITSVRPPLRSQAIPQVGAWFFGFGVVACIGALAASGGLLWYRQSLERARAEWHGEVDKQEKALKPITDLVDYSNTLLAARELLTGHVFTSNALLLLQEMTHSRVRFVNFALLTEGRTINLAGTAASYQTVAEQISLFESRADAVERVDFGGLSRNDKGLVEFNMLVAFRPSLLELRSRSTQER